MSIIQALFFDGDDTLWKMQDAYDEAKLLFSRLLNSIGIPDRNVIHELDALDAQRVAVRGFTNERFLESMLILYAQLSTKYGLPWQTQVEKEIQNISLLLYRPPELFEDTLSTLNSLEGKFQLYLYSAGNPRVQKTKINHLKLLKYFKKVYIVNRKNEDILQRIIRKEALSPERAWIIGNSLRSDIIPAIGIGLNAIYIPRGDWKYDEEAKGVDGENRYYTVNTLSEAASIIIKSKK